jgi:hypothetical protein
MCNFLFLILLSDLTTRSERAEKEKADMQKKMAAYKQQYEDLLGKITHHLKLILFLKVTKLPDF